MRISKILLIMAIVIACCYDIEASIEMQFAKLICNGLTEGTNFIYCLANYPLDTNCYRSKLSIHFYSYAMNTKDNDAAPKEEIIKLDRQLDFNFDPEKKTIIIIHGYLVTRKAAWISSMMKELHKFGNENKNIIVVQWFKNIVYSKAAETVDEVANKTANMVKKIFEKKGKPIHLHIIGHSLGAHIAGLTASKLKDSSWTVDRVTGLDPAKPGFDSDKNAAYRLNKNCANFVDVIHTNSGPNDEPTFGIYEPVGHVDFYPNGGDYQPACISNPKGKIFDNGDLNECLESSTIADDGPKLTLNFMGRLSNGSNMICDHEIAPLYFTESLRKGHKYLATKVESFKKLSENAKNELRCITETNCETDSNCAEMGINAAKYSNIRQGIYLLKTNCGSEDPKDYWSSVLIPWLDTFLSVKRGIFNW